ncbi:MAG: S-methyl-5'-thioinosine phosphorylase [Xanthomonadales bacterium]|nr:S-methyl-5'-thioinosine phosphorylase [Xanthomonadales bacterium]
MPTPRLAIIGGTGFYRLPDLELTDSLDLDTPFGPASGPIRMGEWGGVTVAFLARHGEQHQYAPHRVNYRANLWALREAGVQQIVAVNAVGGIAADCRPQALIVPDQLVDYTWGRESSFANEARGEVNHIDFSDPFDDGLRQAILESARSAGVNVVDGGTFAVTQGPRLETRAEIRRLQQDGCTIVGMTSMPEAALARELALHYASLAVVANWAAGIGDQMEITMAEIESNLAEGMHQVGRVLRILVAGRG